LRALPAHAVGARTAEEAEACGFRPGLVGDSDATAILADIAAAGGQRILHLTGEATAPVRVPPTLHLLRVPVYRAQRIARLPADALAALAEGRVLATLLFSARTARHFRGLVDEAGLDPGRLAVVALSPAVAEAAGAGWASVACAPRPDLAGALAAARQLWQGLPDGR
jgi:uroporphyrinogen-III synthase